MKTLQKPKALKQGDIVATVSLSWGGAGDAEFRWRYGQGKKRLEEEFGLRVKEMNHTLAGSGYVYEHPEKRAQDLMEAFQDPEVKAVIACIGGNDSIRMLPYIDFDVLKDNPKIFSGFSDSTVTHFMCMKAGISSIYGPSVLTDFAENVRMLDYTKEWIRKNWFETDVIGNIPASEVWTSEFLPWEKKNQNTARRLQESEGYELYQGSGSVKGRLIGGCFEVMEMMKGTALFPAPEAFDDTILFIETCEEMISPELFEEGLRWFSTMGILQRTEGIALAKPYDDKYHQEYKAAIIKVLRECGREEIPVLANMNFGHTSPMICMPYGALAEIDCDRKEFHILESAVI